MRGFLLILGIVGLVALDPAQSRAQQAYPYQQPYSYLGPVWSDQTMPINLMPGWPPIQQSRPVRGMFGDRVLGQTLRPRDYPSRFGSAGLLRGPGGDFVGIGAKNPAPVFAQTPPAYAPPAQVPPPPSQMQPTQVLPEQPLPQGLREQLAPEE